MSEVKRYQWVGVRGLAEQDNGRWVKHEDYAALKAERDALAANVSDGLFHLAGAMLNRPAPAADLAELVPEEMNPKQASRSYGGEVVGYRDGWNACRAEMLRLIEEAKK